MPPRNRKYRQPARTGPDTSTWTPEERAARQRALVLQTPLAETTLAVRVVNTLEENGVILVEHLMAQTYESLLGMKNFGVKTLTEVKAAVKKLGLTPPEWKKPPKPKKPPKAKGGGNVVDINLW